MGGDGGGASWADVEAAAPDLAASVAARFDANLHHVIGTLRGDGAPRLSGTEVTVGGGELSVGMMRDSRKLADVRRDPRAEIHSAPIEEDLAGGDAKVAGRVVDAGPVEGAADGAMFVLRLELVSLVRVDGDELVLTTWTPARGLREVRRH